MNLMKWHERSTRAIKDKYFLFTNFIHNLLFAAVSG
jgi:hypothetical protein